MVSHSEEEEAMHVCPDYFTVVFTLVVTAVANISTHLYVLCHHYTRLILVA